MATRPVGTEGAVVSAVTPASVTVKIWPPTVNVADLAEEVVLGATRYVAFPFPDPVLVQVNQDALLDALQAQPAPVVTANPPIPPSDGQAELVGEIEYVQMVVVAMVALTV